MKRTQLRLTVGQFFALACAVLGVVALAGFVGGELGLEHLSDARDQTVSQIDPASRAALGLAAALIDEETGVRGYVITRQHPFLSPYLDGRRRERTAFARLGTLSRKRSLADARVDIAAVQSAANAWRSQYALPTIALRRHNPNAQTTTVQTDAGRALFDTVRVSLSRLDNTLATTAHASRARLRRSATLVEIVFVVFAVLLLILAALLALALRRLISQPLAQLGDEVREVARGSFHSSIDRQGPRDVAELASDVDTMRVRILHELDALAKANARLDAQTHDLERSNSELEQFAYVASHDLQEPLRKVASFTQLLQRRYGGQLDERADEYISYAVDGAKRMQTLINDLLAFSRVGRTREPQTEVDLGEVLSQALAGLSTLIEETRATINAGELPAVRGEPALLSLVLQNLVGNALKFTGDERPIVRIRAQRKGADWLISCSDNGIGIDPQYAERVFVIFQRLHPKDEYAGTGIGLAMCRKIVEYHGGRIWLDPDTAQGTTFRFTLPAA
ncbi:MAG TPA: ATP-binding protein [Solirubrobacteraceae bacterium]|nr:ATP-binding protein [Solirubrobacteraceae bacterium]